MPRGFSPTRPFVDYCWEAYALASTVSLDERPVTPTEEAPRTITITVKGNVHLIVE
jgi:hypothetical protein